MACVLVYWCALESVGTDNLSIQTTCQYRPPVNTDHLTRRVNGQVALILRFPGTALSVGI